MKKVYLAAGILLFATQVRTQTVSTFEALPLGTDTFWDGSDQTAGFSNGNAWFHNTYDGNWMYWSAGWAYSNVQDSVTSGAGNLFASKALTGNDTSANYAIGQQNARIRLTGAAAGGAVLGVYVTNTTYAYNSMRDGDAFAKQFGGVTGNDPDFFKLTFRKYYGGNMTNDSVEFFLADYRFVNNAQDYLVDTWTWVDLSTLGLADSLELILTSSDTGALGYNTPLFYCIDDFTTADGPLGITENQSTNFNVYPNPAQDAITISIPGATVSSSYLYDMNGRLVKSLNGNNERMQMNLEGLAPGIYLLRVESGNTVRQLRISKI